MINKKRSVTPTPDPPPTRRYDLALHPIPQTPPPPPTVSPILELPSSGISRLRGIAIYEEGEQRMINFDPALILGEGDTLQIIPTKPPMRTSIVLEAKVKVTLKKTGKSYYRTMNYAKHTIGCVPGEPKEKAVHEYFLREGRGWRKVTEDEFKKATTKEAVRKLQEKLQIQLKERVTRIMEKS